MSCDDGTSSSADLAAAEAAVARVATSGLGPQTVSGDAGSVTMYPVKDLIAAANFLYGIAAAKTPSKGVRLTRMIPDATVQGPRQSFRGRWGGPDWNGYGWP